MLRRIGHDYYLISLLTFKWNIYNNMFQTTTYYQVLSVMSSTARVVTRFST